MPDLLTELRRHSRVGLDSVVFIYGFEGAANYAKLARLVLDGIASGIFTGVTSTLTLMELTVRPHQLRRLDLVADYEFYVSNLPNLTVAEVSTPTARRAAELRAAHRLAPVDAVQIAACLERQATVFITNDRRLRRVSEIEILMLDDFLPAVPSLTRP